MPEAAVIARVVAVCSLAFTLSTCVVVPAQTTVTVDFKVTNGYMMVVPVSINGRQPIDFLVDTGTSRTMIERNVADQLELPKVATGMIDGVQGTMRVSLAHTNSVSLGGAKVSGLNLTVAPEDAGLPHDLRGILGEDFLERFDVLIDNRHHRIELDLGSGTIGNALDGERLPIRLDGMSAGGPTTGRLIVASRAPELSRDEITLLLDSGINSLVFLREVQGLGVGAVKQTYRIASPSRASDFVQVSTRVVQQLRIGNRVLTNVNAVAPPARPDADTDGLLPTSFFTSVFVSHSQKYVIFNPSRRH